MRFLLSIALSFSFITPTMAQDNLVKDTARWLGKTAKAGVYDIVTITDDMRGYKGDVVQGKMTKEAKVSEVDAFMEKYFPQKQEQDAYLIKPSVTQHYNGDAVTVDRLTPYIDENRQIDQPDMDEITTIKDAEILYPVDDTPVMLEKSSVLTRSPVTQTVGEAVLPQISHSDMVRQPSIIKRRQMDQNDMVTEPMMVEPITLKPNSNQKIMETDLSQTITPTREPMNILRRSPKIEY